jgi:hypothetical protein
MRKRKRASLCWLPALMLELMSVVVIVTIARPTLAVAWLNHLRPLEWMNRLSIERCVEPSVEISSYQGYYDVRR